MKRVRNSPSVLPPKKINDAGLAACLLACLLTLDAGYAMAGGTGGSGSDDMFPGPGGTGSDGTASNKNGATYNNSLYSPINGGSPGQPGKDAPSSDSGGGGGGGNSTTACDSGCPAGSGGASPWGGAGGNGGALGGYAGDNAPSATYPTGGGGGGGDNLYISADTTITTTVSGGKGGNGASTSTTQASGGGGGGGGAALISDGITHTIVISETGQLTGGAGGNGGDTSAYAVYGGGGGGGGAGIGASNLEIVNRGMISGGQGGNAGSSVEIGNLSHGGQGGSGIVGSDLFITNDGTIRKGNDGANIGYFSASERTNAITFTGGHNTLILKSGSLIDGNISGENYTLTIESGATLAGNLRVTGSLVLDQSDSVTLPSGYAITGSGSIYKTGSGTLTLDGDNTYSGSSSITGGRLVLQGDTASSSFNVASSSSLVFDQSNSYTLSAPISGAGNVSKAGSNTLTLDGNNTYTGSTSITGGSLVVQGETASSSFNVASSASLVFDQSSSHTLSAPISGAGNVTKQGSGTLTFNGDNTYTGTTSVKDGVLIINGAMSTSTIDVTNAKLVVNSSITGIPLLLGTGSTLGGRGAFGNLILTPNSTIAPGNSIGTMTVAGDLTFAPTSTYSVEVDPASTSSDLINVTGTAHLNNATVHHVGQTGTYKPSSQYTILTAGSIDGTFGSVSSDFAFLTPSLSYDATNVYLKLLRNDTRFSSLAQSQNQTGVANTLDALGQADPNNALYTQIVGQTKDQVPDTYDMLSGDALVSTMTAGRDLMRRFGQTLRNQSVGLGNTSPQASGHTFDQQQDGRRFWAQVQRSNVYEDTDSAMGNAAYRLDSNMAAMGMELDQHDWRWGAAVSVSNGQMNYRNRAASGDLEAQFVGLYGRWQADRLYVRGDLTYGWMQNKTRRTVNGQPAKSDADLQAGRAALEAGVQIPWQGMTLQPYAMLAGEWLERDGFSESGSTGAELSVGRSALTSTEATLGVDLTKAFEVGETSGHLQVGVAAVQALGDTQAEQTARFKTGSTPFTTYSANRNDPQAQLSLGAELAVGKNLSLSGGYMGRFGQYGRTHAAQIRVAYRW